MPMNAFHRRFCASPDWANFVEGTLLPWGLDGVELGDDVLEIGPGFGVTTRLLASQVPRLTALEVDGGFAERLRATTHATVEVVSGDGAAMPFPDNRFSAVVCFTMLHHVPSSTLQDRLFAQSCRVLRPGGVFAGTDSQSSWRFRLIHLFDTMVVVDPKTLPERLRAAGLTGVHVDVDQSVRFRAFKPLMEQR
jgi:ubiquinone/menaquinone biosynthesis C-methylase UbiE